MEGVVDGPVHCWASSLTSSTVTVRTRASASVIGVLVAAGVEVVGEGASLCWVGEVGAAGTRRTVEAPPEACSQAATRTPAATAASSCCGSGPDLLVRRLLLLLLVALRAPSAVADCSLGVS